MSVKTNQDINSDSLSLDHHLSLKDRRNRFERREKSCNSGSREKGNNKFPTFQPNSTKNNNERYHQERNTVTSEDGDEINVAETELMSKSANKLLRIIKTPTR